MRTKLFLFLVILYWGKFSYTQQIQIFSDSLLNGPEGIIYDEENSQYFVGNASDGKLLLINSERNISVFKENIGAEMLMSLEILGDSLFISTNYPPSLVCLNKNTGDSIYQLVLDTMATSLSQMTYDDETGHLYIVDQSGKILKVDVADAKCSLFVTGGLPSSIQSIELDKSNNRLIVFSWPTSMLKFVNLNDSTDITNGPSILSGQNTCTCLDEDGYIYVSTWVGNKVKKLHLDTLEQTDFFCQDSLNKPVGITYNSTNNEIAVCNYGNNTITFIDKNYSTIRTHLLQKNNLYDLNLYYNPKLKKVNVLLPKAPIGSYNFSVINISGKELANENFQIETYGLQKFTIDTPNLSSGIYFMKISDSAKILRVKKFVNP